MHLHSVLSSLSDSHIQIMLMESMTFRRAVSEYLTKNKTKPKKKNVSGERLIEALKETIRNVIPGYKTNRIEAIKYFRDYRFSDVTKNELKKMGVMDHNGFISLFEAKKFIESL